MNTEPNHPARATSHDREFEDCLAREITKSPTPTWLKIGVVLSCLALIAACGVARWITVHPEQFWKLMDDLGVENPKPFLIGMALTYLAVAVYVARRRLRETDTTLKWWVQIYCRRWSARLRPSARTKRRVVGVCITMMSVVQKIKASTAAVVCVIAVVLTVGVIYYITTCDRWTYLTVELDDKGLPVRGSWGVSEATPATLAKDDRRRAEGPFKRSDGDAARRAEINNAWDAESFDQTKYPYPMGPLADSPKQRITMERKTWGTNPRAPRHEFTPATEAPMQTIVDGSENWRFVQLPSWTLTNAASMNSAEFTRTRPELGGLSVADCVNEANTAGTLYVSEAPTAFFTVRTEPVPPEAKPVAK